MQEEEIEIIVKNGTRIILTITGTQEKPEIRANEVKIAGKILSGIVHIQHWKHKGAEEGLLFTYQNVYVQCKEAMPTIRATIKKLPLQKYWARKSEKTIDLDGDLCKIQKWEFDKILKTEKNTYIPEIEMGNYLDSKNITEIQIDDAIRMWVSEKKENYIHENSVGEQVRFEIDEIEEG